MSHKFPTISVTKLFVSIDPRPATEEERWMGLPVIVPGLSSERQYVYRPSDAVASCRRGASSGVLCQGT